MIYFSAFTVNFPQFYYYILYSLLVKANAIKFKIFNNTEKVPKGFPFRRFFIQQRLKAVLYIHAVGSHKPAQHLPAPLFDRLS